MSSEAIGQSDPDQPCRELRLALTHLVQILGEAGGRVSREFCQRHPEVLWTELVGMRHKVVYDYLGVDEDIVWQGVTEDLPPLTETLERLTPRLDLPE